MITELRSKGCLYFIDEGEKVPPNQQRAEHEADEAAVTSIILARIDENHHRIVRYKNEPMNI